MAAVAQSQAERAEVEAVLRSGIFHRAPNVEHLFRYVCERYFAGEADKVKEYNIAVEALGRPSTFDQKKDAIVRVEAHRLRKRLSEYYAADGANHAIQIKVPPGHYVPLFLVREPAPEPPVPQAGAAADSPLAFLGSQAAPTGERLAVIEVPQPAVDPSTVGARRTRTAWPAIALLCLALSAASIWLLSQRRHSPPEEVWQGSWEPVEGEVRFLAGSHGSPLHDRQGRVWAPDRYYKGGTAMTVTKGRPYEALPDSAFAHSYREGTFRYDIPLVSGTYELRLYFIETRFGEGNPGGGAVNARMFQVNLNAKPLLELFDTLSEAGAPNRLHTRVFQSVSPAEDGKLHLAFQPMNDAPAFLAAVELLPTSPGHVRPIRIVAQKTNVVDTGGTLWQADQYAVGGTQVDRATPADEPERMLFRGERYGNFAYHVPVAAGRYRLRLYFAETFFGSRLPYARNNAADPRVFNVFANGVALLRNLNVAKETGGPNRPLIKTFDNVEPNAQGLILLQFIPVHNYAEVNAIEVVQME